MSDLNTPKDQTLVELLSTLQVETGLGKPRTPPPMHKWNPTHCGDIGLKISKDGVWSQHGVRFTRERLVRLFSTIMRRDADEYFLVTPHEKVVLHVEDVPFVATRVDRIATAEGPAVAVTTNVGDTVAIGGDHPLRLTTCKTTGEPSVYVEIRSGLEARLARPPFYELVGMADLSDDGSRLILRSGGSEFDLGAVS